MDGFSRRIMWLKVARKNNNPAVIAKFFLSSVVEEGGCPTILRTDNGTKNVIVAGMQCYFRCPGNDEYAGVKAHTITFKSSWDTNGFTLHLPFHSYPVKKFDLPLPRSPIQCWV